MGPDPNHPTTRAFLKTCNNGHSLHAWSCLRIVVQSYIHACLRQLGCAVVRRSSSWLHIHIRIFAYSSTCYGTPKIYKCFRFPVLLNTPDILLGILFDYTTLHRVTIIFPKPLTDCTVVPINVEYCCLCL